MVACARRNIVDRSRSGVYHCWTRCVRRAFLCGKDPYTKKDYSHRRGWIRQRLEQLAALFAIEVGFFSVMQNHLHRRRFKARAPAKGAPPKTIHCAMAIRHEDSWQ